MRIGLQADDVRWADLIARVLEAAGHSVFEISAGFPLGEAPSGAFDLVILQWRSLSRGLEILASSRETVHGDPAVVIVAGPGHDGDVAAALKAGADDMLILPIGDALLTARIEAVLRRRQRSHGPARLELFGEYRFDTAQRLISHRGAPLPVTEKEFALALLLFRNLGRDMPRSQLMDAVWGYPGAKSRTLDAHISSVRRKLRLLPESGLAVRAIYGLGYRLDRVE